jgi:hypothetical protein
MKSQSSMGLAFLVSIGRFLGQAGVKSAHIIPLWDGVTVRVGVAEENFERALGYGHLVSHRKWCNGIIQLKTSIAVNLVGSLIS